VSKDGGVAAPAQSGRRRRSTGSGKGGRAAWRCSVRAPAWD